MYRLEKLELAPYSTIFQTAKAFEQSNSGSGFETGPGLPPIMRDAFSLANMIRSHASKDTKTDLNFKVNAFFALSKIIPLNQLVQFLSPRFAPVMPDKLDSSGGFLSPSVLAFYKDDTEQQIAPIPKVDSIGLNRRLI